MGRKKKYIDEVLEKAIQEGRAIWPPLEDKNAKLHIIGEVDRSHKKFSVMERYEMWKLNGKDWSNWHRVNEFDTEKEAKEYIKKYKANSVNKKVHLKEELKIVENN